MAKRSDVLEFAVLGLLHESPLHGYELRKRLNATLGAFRAFSYGSLYPCLKALLAAGLVTQSPEPAGATDPTGTAGAAGLTGAAGAAGKRSRIVYQLTAEGKEHFVTLLGQSGPSAWDDEGFGVHFAFFGRTDTQTRLRILEGRRSRLEERVDVFRAALSRSRERVDGYTLALHQHGLESVEREVRWLSELIDDERRRGTQADQSSPTTDSPLTVPGQPTGPGKTPAVPVTAEHGEANDKEHP